MSGIKCKKKGRNASLHRRKKLSLHAATVNARKSLAFECVYFLWMEGLSFLGLKILCQILFQRTSSVRITFTQCKEGILFQLMIHCSLLCVKHTHTHTKANSTHLEPFLVWKANLFPKAFSRSIQSISQALSLAPSFSLRKIGFCNCSVPAPTPKRMIYLPIFT